MPVGEDRSAAPDGRLLLDDDGHVLARFLEGEREGHRLADLIEPEDGADEAMLAGIALRDLSGWFASAGLGIGQRLIAGGALPVRHAHTMQLDLGHPPPAAPPAGVRIVAFAHSGEQLAPSWMAAYPPGHLDFRPGEDELPGALEALDSVIADPGHWPLLPCSRVAEAVDTGRVLGAALVNDNPPRPPFGGAWLAELFREPGRRGVGAALLRSALHAAALDGHATVQLAVTEGNPARRLYDALGFRVITSSLTVEVP